MKLPLGKRLTAKMIEDAKTEGEQDAFLWDGEIHGFGVRVRASGVKSFVFQYKTHAGAQRRVTIEKVGGVRLEDARESARKLKAIVADGGDPKADRDALREAPTVKELTEEYLTKHAVPRKRESSVAEDRAMIRDHIVPTLGNKKVAAVTREDVRALHRRMKDTPVRANRVRALISKMMALALEWGWRETNPVVGVEKYREQHRERWLTPEETKRLTDVLNDHPNRTGANAAWLLLLTGSRRSEVLKAKWEEFDLENGIWTKPSHRTKQKKTEHVPLSKDALELLRTMHKEAREGAVWLFEGRDHRKPFGGFSRFWNSVRKKAALPDFRVHDCRHNFASMLVQQGYSLPQIGKLLGHADPSTTNRYAHHNIEELRKLSDAAGQRFVVITGGKGEQALQEAVALSA